MPGFAFHALPPPLKGVSNSVWAVSHMVFQLFNGLRIPPLLLCHMAWELLSLAVASQGKQIGQRLCTACDSTNGFRTRLRVAFLLVGCMPCRHSETLQASMLRGHPHESNCNMSWTVFERVSVLSTPFAILRAGAARLTTGGSATAASRTGRKNLYYLNHICADPGWRGAEEVLSTVSTVDWVLRGSGESDKM